MNRAALISHQPQVDRRSVSLSSLLWFYALIPAVLVTVAVDVLLFDGWLAGAMDNRPRSYLVLALIFGPPHIVASNVLMFSNGRYVRHFWKRIAGYSAAIAAFFLVFGWWFHRDLIFALAAGWTVAHVVKQQIGIGNMASRLDGPTFRAWYRIGIAGGIAFYLGIYLSDAWSPLQQELLGGFVLLCSLTVLAMSALLWSHVSGLGRSWFVANSVTMILPGLLYLGGYPLFAILIPRVVHDGTAFLIYIAHDTNRVRAGVPSIIYRWHSVPAAIVVPTIAIGFAAFCEQGGDRLLNRGLQAGFGFTLAQPLSIGLLGFLSLLHYAMESVTWTGDSPYREHLTLRL